MKICITVTLLLSLATALRAQAPLYDNRITTKSIYLLPVFSNDTNLLPDRFVASSGTKLPANQEVFLRKVKADPLSFKSSVDAAFMATLAGRAGTVSDDDIRALFLANADKVAAYLANKAAAANNSTASAIGFSSTDPYFKRKINIRGGTKFQVVDRTESAYIIRLGNWLKDSINYLYNKTTDGKQVYYLLPLDALNDLSDPLLTRWSVTGGIFTIPFKYRPQDGTFEPSFAVSGGAGFQLNFHQRDIKTITFLGAIGASTVQLTKYSAKLPEGTDKLTTAGFTPSVSIIYQYKKFQVGLPIGLDVIFDNKTYSWSNQAKPWFALSLGVGIFTSSKPAESTGTN